MRKLTHQEIVERQQRRAKEMAIPLIVVLDNIRSLHNVGAIFRTADGVGVEKLWLCGITGFPPQSQITKTALGAEDRVPWEHSHDVLAVVTSLKNRGHAIIALEQTEQSLNFDQFEVPFPICLIVGNEIEGISPELLSLCDGAVEIPMAGAKNSLNAAVAFGVVAYQIRSQFTK